MVLPGAPSIVKYMVNWQVDSTTGTISCQKKFFGVMTHWLNFNAVMSGNGTTDVVLRGVTHGAVDFLIKPVRLEELRNAWQHVVRRKRIKVAPCLFVCAYRFHARHRKDD
jgi:hypothetical protein